MNIWIDDDYDKNLSICPFIIVIKKNCSEMRAENWINLHDMKGGEEKFLSRYSDNNEP